MEFLKKITYGMAEQQQQQQPEQEFQVRINTPDIPIPKIKYWHKLFACQPSLWKANRLSSNLKSKIGLVLCVKVETFPDGNQRILVPMPDCDGQNLIYIASYWHNDEQKMTDLRIIQFLSERGARHLTVIIPFFGSATNERAEVGISQQGVGFESIAIAATDAKMLSSIGNGHTRVRIMLYDLHTLQNRFYFTPSVNVVMDSTIPCALSYLDKLFDIIAFPDDGSKKRFSSYIDSHSRPLKSTYFYKERGMGDLRVLKSADPLTIKNERVLIVDDLIRSGQTIGECALACRELGAKDVIVFVPHAVFPKGEYVKFESLGSFGQAVSTFYTTSSNSNVTNQLLNSTNFRVFDFADIVAWSCHF